MTEIPQNRRKRRTDLSSEDLELWRRIVSDVAPLHRRARAKQTVFRQDDSPLPGAAKPAETDVTGSPPNSASLKDRRARSAPAPPPLDGSAGVDRASAERLKRGKRAIEARLDLHGMTQSEAYRALAGFIVKSRIAGRRCVLVITGRGRLGSGILKQAVPRWLAEPELRQHVLAMSPAQPQHGGPGALYLLLKRVR